jgi:hypothetical protein
MTKLENRCANCGGKFGLVYHNHWGLRFCRKACKADFLAKTAKDHARMRKWFGRAASSERRTQPIRRQPAQAETEAECGSPDFTYLAHQGRHLLALGERGLRSASKVDYLIRRWIIPDHPCDVRRSLSEFAGAPGEIRTHDLCLRRAVP